MNPPSFTRPPLDEVLIAWQACLAAHRLPEQMLWIFSENICLEASSNDSDAVRLGFQTRFTPPPSTALEIAYDQFSETPSRIVFYRLGSSPHGSVCLLLCDHWFEAKGEREGFIRHDDWGISLHPGPAGDIEEVTELTRWLHRVKHRRALRDLDFAMSLETIDEIRIHGRTLQPYERFAEKMLSRLRQVLGNPS